MGKIKRIAIEKQIKEEYKEARRWCNLDSGHYYQMMIDTEDGEIWSDCFISTNDWKQYHSDTITSLDAMPGYVKEVETEYIEDAVNKLQAAGWEIEG